jgi:hypothetical protein
LNEVFQEDNDRAMPMAQQPQFEFSWDERKAAANLHKHGVAFELAATVFRRRSTSAGRQEVCITSTAAPRFFSRFRSKSPFGNTSPTKRSKGASVFQPF